MTDMNGNAAARLYTQWIAELSNAITPRRSARRQWRTLLSPSYEGLRVSAITTAGETEIATLNKDASADEIATVRKAVNARAPATSKYVLMRLSPHDVLERQIQIPKAATDVIEPVLRNQMERLVPWPETDTSYGYVIAGNNAQDPDQVDLVIVATSNETLDAALELAKSINLSPAAVEFVSESIPDRPIQLLSLEPDPLHKTAKALHSVLAVLLTLSLAMGGYGAYLAWHQHSENQTFGAELQTATHRVDEVKRLNNENLELRQQRGRLVIKKRDMPPTIMLIEALSRTLPDTSYITALELHGNEMRIVGKSDDPTSLITTLEATEEFKDIRFAAPTTREAGETVDTFSIVGRIEALPEADGQP